MLDRLLALAGLAGMRERYTRGECYWAVGLALTLGLTLGVMFDHPTDAENAEDGRDGYYQIRPFEKPTGKPNHLAMVLAMACDWLETVDPGYAEEILGFGPQSDEVQAAIASLQGGKTC